MKHVMKYMIALLVTLLSSAAFADVINLNTGDVLTLNGTTVTCNVDPNSRQHTVSYYAASDCQSLAEVLQFSNSLDSNRQICADRADRYPLIKSYKVDGVCYQYRTAEAYSRACNDSILQIQY